MKSPEAYLYSEEEKRANFVREEKPEKERGGTMREFGGTLPRIMQRGGLFGMGEKAQRRVKIWEEKGINRPWQNALTTRRKRLIRIKKSPAEEGDLAFKGGVPQKGDKAIGWCELNPTKRNKRKGRGSNL